MQLDTIKRKTIKVYNTDVEVIKYVLGDVYDNDILELGRTNTRLIPNEDMIININIPEEKYSNICRIFNKMILSTDRVIGLQQGRRMSFNTICKIVSMLDNRVIRYKPSGTYRVLAENRIIIEKRRYIVDGKYYVTSYRNILTGDEAFVKYMDYKRRIFATIMIFIGSNAVIKLIKANSKLSLHTIISVIVCILTNIYISNYYSKIPNRYIKKIGHIISFIYDIIC